MAGPPLASGRRPAAAARRSFWAFVARAIGIAAGSAGGTLAHGSHGRRRAISAFPTSFLLLPWLCGLTSAAPASAPRTPPPRHGTSRSIFGCPSIGPAAAQRATSRRRAATAWKHWTGDGGRACKLRQHPGETNTNTEATAPYAVVGGCLGLAAVAGVASTKRASLSVHDYPHTHAAAPSHGCAMIDDVLSRVQ